MFIIELGYSMVHVLYYVSVYLKDSYLGSVMRNCNSFFICLSFTYLNRLYDFFVFFFFFWDLFAISWIRRQESWRYCIPKLDPCGVWNTLFELVLESKSSLNTNISNNNLSVVYSVFLQFDRFMLSNYIDPRVEYFIHMHIIVFKIFTVSKYLSWWGQ